MASSIPDDSESIDSAKSKKRKISKKLYKSEFERLQTEMVKLQEWVRQKKLKVVVIFEGRDAAGKGGVIKRITERMNPRIAHVVALGKPTEKEKPNGIFSAMCHICRPQVKLSCLIEAGITGQALKGSWDFAQTLNMKNSCVPARNLNVY